MSFERIRKIENELETGQLSEQGRSIIHDVKIPKVSSSWDNVENSISQTDQVEAETPLSPNWFKRIFFISIAFVCIAGGFFAFSFLIDPARTSQKNVSVTVSARSLVDAGTSFPVTVTVVNKNNIPLEYVKVFLEYPQNPGGALEGLYQEKSIDSIAPGETREVPFNVTLYGNVDTSRKLSAKISYSIPGSVAFFELSHDTEVVLSSSPVKLALQTPGQVFPNQEVVFTVVYTSELADTAPSSLVQIEYPIGFSYVSADPKPDIGTTNWKLGTLLPGDKKIITIRGIMSGSLGEKKLFKATIGSLAQNQTDFESIYTSTTSETTVTEPFLATSIKTANAVPVSDIFIIEPQKETEVTIYWKNTQKQTLTNVKLSVQLTGNLFDASIITPRNGFFNNDTNTITWTSNEVPTFANLEPGAEGEVSFGIKELSAIDQDQNIIPNPLLVMNTSAEAYISTGEKLVVSGAANYKLTLNTEPTLVTKLITSSVPIKNTGTYPPRNGKESTYTVYLQLANTLHDIENVRVVTKLPQWVTYTSNVSPQTAKDFIEYNPATHSVTWSPGLLAAGAGYTKKTPEIYFQISIKPSSSQINTAPPLTGVINVLGDNTFNKSPIKFSRDALGTRDTVEESSSGPVLK